MTAPEEQLRTELHNFDPWALREIRPPRDPDRWVFGQMYERGELQAVWTVSRCPVHDAGWNGAPDGCWCCEAGIAPLKN